MTDWGLRRETEGRRGEEEDEEEKEEGEKIEGTAVKIDASSDGSRDISAPVVPFPRSSCQAVERIQHFL